MRGRRFPLPAPLVLLASALLLASEPVYSVPTQVSVQRFRYHYRYRAVTGGVVVADMQLDRHGSPRELRVRHGDSPFRDLAASLVRGWKLELPEDAPEQARVAAVFVFRRPQLLGAEPTVRQLPELNYKGPESPPQPRRIVEPTHPLWVTADGVAVVSVAVSKTGAVTGVTPLSGAKEFLRAARRAISRWEFDPARHENEAVAGGLVVAVYFPRPSL